MIPRPGPAAALVAGRALGAAVAFLIPVALARLLQPAEFGTYKQLFLIFGTLYGVAQVGLAESLFYFLPATPADAGRHAANSLCGLAAAGAACLAALWLGRQALARWLGNDALAGLLPLLGLAFLPFLAAAGLEIVLTARRRFAAAAASYALSDLLRTALLVVPVAALGGLEGLLLGAIGFGFLRLGAAVAVAAREFGRDLRPDRVLLRRQLGYALPFALAVLVEVAQANYHQYAVAHRFDPATFAVYAIGCLQVPLVDLIAGPASNVMMVRMAEARRDGRAGALRDAWLHATRSLALVFVPLVGALLVTARDLLPFLFGDAYRASVPIFMVWSATFLLAALPLDGVLRAFADTRALLVISALKLAVIAAVIGPLLDEFGLVGAVAATVAAAAAAKALMLARMRRLLGLVRRDLLPWRDLAAIGACGALAALPALAAAGMAAAVPIRIAAAGLAYAAAYGLLVLLCGAVRRGRRTVAAAGLPALGTGGPGRGSG